MWWTLLLFFCWAFVREASGAEHVTEFRVTILDLVANNCYLLTPSR